MIDVFIMTLPGDNQEWFQECLKSLEGEPVTVRVIDGIPGQIGKARRLGFAQGDAPYVAYVDPDDYVRPGAFAACKQALDNNPQAAMAYTREARVDRDGLLIVNKNKELYERFIGKPFEPFYAHHLSVYRRSALPDLSFLDDYSERSEQVLKERIWGPDKFVFVDMLGYCWRKHGDQVSAKTAGTAPHLLDLAKRRAEALCLSSI